jgi:hypothetical protein
MEAMRRGDFTAAWEETDRIEIERRALEKAGRLIRQEHHLLWNGLPFSGNRVVVRCHHGLGDTLQFLRFVPHLRELAHQVTLLVQPALLPLLGCSERFGEIRNGWCEEPLPAHEVEIEIMELAYAFRCTPETLPNNVPYLPTDSLGRARAGFPIQSGAFNVGLLWAASEWNPRRSIPIQKLDPLRHIENVRFYSLQQGIHAGERSALKLEPLSDQTREITQAAAAMMQMDLILTVDSMAAHLAGALGCPVWMLLRNEADWRWLANRPDSPWYPTMRIFRQPKEGAWEPVIQEVARALRQIVPIHCRDPI